MDSVESYEETTPEQIPFASGVLQRLPSAVQAPRHCPASPLSETLRDVEPGCGEPNFWKMLRAPNVDRLEAAILPSGSVGLRAKATALGVVSSESLIIGASATPTVDPEDADPASVLRPPTGISRFDWDCGRWRWDE